MAQPMEPSKILDEIVKKEGRARLIRHERNLGIVATLNHAIDECKGEFMAYMHADDISAVVRIEHFIQFLNNYPDTDLMAARYRWMNEKGKVSCSVRAKATLPKSIKFAVFFITPMPHPLLMGKPELFRKYRYDPEYEYSEDYDLISRIALANMTLRNIDESLYFIRLNDQRLSYKYEDRQDKNHIKVSFRNIINYFGIHPDPVIHRIVANRIEGSVSPSQGNRGF
jgi:glycosyltransferase involved in cell wall biosynthesis